MATAVPGALLMPPAHLLWLARQPPAGRAARARGEVAITTHDVAITQCPLPLRATAGSRDGHADAAAAAMVNAAAVR